MISFPLPHLNFSKMLEKIQVPRSLTVITKKYPYCILVLLTHYQWECFVIQLNRLCLLSFEITPSLKWNKNNDIQLKMKMRIQHKHQTHVLTNNKVWIRKLKYFSYRRFRVPYCNLIPIVLQLQVKCTSYC